jgi:hypothetical protein
MKKTFFAEIKWGICDGNPNLDDLPEDFKKAKKELERKSSDSFQLLAPFLRCVFVRSNLIYDISDLIIEKGDEFEAVKVTILGVDFDQGNLPAVRAAAKFIIDCDKHLTKPIFDEWQEENEMLDSAISFQWALPEEINFDLSLSNHKGLSFYLE